jgi:hypothetical protein
MVDVPHAASSKRSQITEDSSSMASMFRQVVEQDGHRAQLGTEHAAATAPADASQRRHAGDA